MINTQKNIPSNGGNRSPDLLQIDTAPFILPTDISYEPFPDHVQQMLDSYNEEDIEIRPDGNIYLPEIKYRRVLNAAFGPGGWVLMPRGPPVIKDHCIFREYALYCFGKYVSQAVGEQQIQTSMTEGTAIEASKSNALMRCCKDLGIANDLWDPNFVDQWKSKNALQTWCKNEKSGELRLLWRRVDRTFSYPWVETHPQQPVPLRTTKQKPTPTRGVPTYTPKVSPTRAIFHVPQREVDEDEEVGEEAVVEEEEQQEEEEVEIPPPVQYNVPSSFATSLQDFNADSFVPPQMKRYKGKTWREVASTKDGLNYLAWASENYQFSKEIKTVAALALEWHDKE